MTTQIATFPAKVLLAMSLDAQEIGERIAQARRRKGWTQLQLALEASVSPSTIARWERGGLPPVRELVRLAGVLEVPAEQLVEDEFPVQAEERLGEILDRLEQVVAALERAAAPTG